MRDNNQRRNPHSDVYCYCSHALNCSLCGKPRDSRASTQEAIRHILEDVRPLRTNVFGNGPLLVSDIPVSAKQQQQQQQQQQQTPIVLGIDEAGRGSVLGPMVYGLAYWSVDAIDRIPTSFNDSKQLSEQQRERIWEEILEHKDIGFAFKALLPNEISRNMLRSPTPYNLNEQSHDTAMMLIRKLQPHHTIQACFIDTVGNPDYYRRKLEREFPGIEFTVESKADAKYASCSAASVVAKVMRDRMSSGWKFSEPGLHEICGNVDFGSGYPSDPKCKAWLKDTLQDKVFGYSDFVRFSWAPIKSRLKGEEQDVNVQVVPVVFAADLDEDEMEQRHSQKGMSAFLGAVHAKHEPNKKRKRSTYFKSRKLHAVGSI